MYAVIRTGGKQYRVSPGDMLVVEKLPGEAGAKVSFDEVLMVGEGSDVTVGAPLVEGASVTATLVETRKGEKIKIFKKIRRQGYRRTRGHRQTESVLRVTAVAGAGKTDTWDGTVDLTPRAVLNARARGLKTLAESLLTGAAPAKAKPAAAPKKAAAPKAKAAPKAEAAAPVEAKAAEAPAKPKAAKAEAKPVEAKAPKAEAKPAAKKPAAKAAPKAEAASEEKAPAKKAPAKKSKPAADGGKA